MASEEKAALLAKHSLPTPGPPAAAKQQQGSRMSLGDVAWWGANVTVSVCIVFVNKLLMGKAGANFQFATTLCALHYLTSSVVASRRGSNTEGGEKRKIPLKDLIVFTAVADVSIISLNLSLMLNTVSFYQIAKLLVIAFVCLVERLWLGRRFSPATVASVVVVALGVGTVTVTDLGGGGDTLGVVIAAISVVASGMQQILCRYYQLKNDIPGNDLLALTAPAQGWSLLLMGPLLDHVITGRWVTEYQWTPFAGAVLVASCSLAAGVNVTQFLCLGRFSAASFQVLGHSKTVLVLLGGWAVLGDNLSLRQLGGMGLAVIGMVCYGVASSQPQKHVVDDAALNKRNSGVQVVIETTSRKESQYNVSQGAKVPRRPCSEVVAKAAMLRPSVFGISEVLQCLSSVWVLHILKAAMLRPSVFGISEFLQCLSSVWVLHILEAGVIVSVPNGNEFCRSVYSTSL